MAIRMKFKQGAGALALVAAILAAAPAVIGLVSPGIQVSQQTSGSPSDIDWPF
jgi:hypothetical protein